jgi:hypothetical protein
MAWLYGDRGDLTFTTNGRAYVATSFASGPDQEIVVQELQPDGRPSAEPIALATHVAFAPRVRPRLAPDRTGGIWAFWIEDVPGPYASIRMAHMASDGTRDLPNAIVTDAVEGGELGLARSRDGSFVLAYASANALNIQRFSESGDARNERLTVPIPSTTRVGNISVADAAAVIYEDAQAHTATALLIREGHGVASALIARAVVPKTTQLVAHNGTFSAFWIDERSHRVLQRELFPDGTTGPVHVVGLEASLSSPFLAITLGDDETLTVFWRSEREEQPYLWLVSRPVAPSQLFLNSALP